MTAVLFLLWCACVAPACALVKTRADRDEWIRAFRDAVHSRTREEQVTLALRIELAQCSEAFDAVLEERNCMAAELGLVRAIAPVKETRSWN